MIHSIGVAMVVASLYFFAMIFHVELRDVIPRWQFYLDVILLQVVVFSYAVTFFADWPTKQGFQKVCIMGVFYVVLKSVSVEEKAFQPREVWGMFGRMRG
ncbi:MAG: hypothetical protein P8046_07990 [Anaerolineales bacterium]